VLFLAKAIRAILWVLLATALSAQTIPSEVRFHALVPLGAEAYQLDGAKWKSVITFLGSAENPAFEGMVRREVKDHAALYAADGLRIKNYPERVSFRVTASYRTRVTDPSPFPISTSDDANDYLLNLRFRIVIFHGLQQTVVHPDSVEMIGMPGEVPYDERVFRIVADLPDTPITDRVVLEVRGPDGKRICKFHLDLI
jgi:hypothetical protein